MSEEQNEHELAEKALREGVADLKDAYSVKNALVAMINDYALKAVEYKTKLDGAQTTTKRNFYTKKLQSNNEEAADAIVALEQILTKEKQSDEPSEESVASVDATETT